MPPPIPVGRILLVLLLAFTVRAIGAVVVVARYDGSEAAVLHPAGDTRAHGIVKGDGLNYYLWTNLIRDQVEREGRPFFLAGPRHENTFLYPRLLAAYALPTGGLALGAGNQVPSGQVLPVLLLQATVAAVAAAALYAALAVALPGVPALAIGLFLAIEPTLAQYSAMLLTESVFVALLQLAIAAWLVAVYRAARPTLWFGVAGAVLGVAFLQRPAAMLLAPLMLAVLLLNARFRDPARLGRAAAALMVPFLTFVVLLGVHNRMRAGFFYILPQQSAFIVQAYVAPEVLARAEGITFDEARLRLNQEAIAEGRAAGLILESDNVAGFLGSDGEDPDWSERQFYDFAHVRRRIGLRALAQYPGVSAAVIVGRTMSSLNVDPFFALRFFGSSYRPPSEAAARAYDQLREQLFPFRLAYSMLMVIPAIAGVFVALRQLPLAFVALLVGLVLYFPATAGYMGNTRYTVPCLIGYAVFWTMAVRAVVRPTVGAKELRI